ncbi:hypothetical protein ACOJBO_32675 [Rhizobium beringeri]
MREVIARSRRIRPMPAFRRVPIFGRRWGGSRLRSLRAIVMPSATGRLSGPDLPLTQLDDRFDAIDDELDRFTEAEPDAIVEILRFIVPQHGIYSFTRNRLIAHSHFLLGNWFINREDYRNAILEYDQALDAKECSEFTLREVRRSRH